jgi:hypothetical protein
MTMSEYDHLSRSEIVALLSSEKARHADTREKAKQLGATVQSLREANLFLERQRMNNASDDMHEYVSRNTSPAAHYIQGLQNQVANLTMSTASKV